MKLTGVKPTKRHPPWEGARIVPFGATKFVIDNVTIDGSTATGVQTARGATDGVISNNRISNTLGDGIHITGRASYITIVGNVIHDTGDDGIAVVSYQGDKGLTHHITAVRNTVSNNKGGRSMSVVGGSDVLYENNRLSNSGNYACLYLAQEDSWKTLPISNVIARNNTLSNCGSPTTGHAAVMLFSDSSANAGVQILRNDIEQSGQAGIRMFGQNNEVTIDGNRVRGARQALAIAGWCEGDAVLGPARWGRSRRNDPAVTFHRARGRAGTDCIDVCSGRSDSLAVVAKDEHDIAVPIPAAACCCLHRRVHSRGRDLPLGR